MATTYNHAQLGIVDASGNVNVIYPITTGADVSITRTNTKLPTAATTAQALANALGKLAFVDSQISDSETSTTKTWSSNKINTTITSLSNSFQAGVDTLYNKCVNCGSTPTAKTPTAISTSIQTIYTNRYNSGYNTGRTQGQNDVKNSPNSYGLYTSTQYTANYNSGRTQGQNDVKGNPNGYGLYTTDQYTANYNTGYNTGRTQGQAEAKVAALGNASVIAHHDGALRPETVDVKTVCSYWNQLTNNNFIIRVTSVISDYYSGDSSGGSTTISHSYNASNGILTINIAYAYRIHRWTFDVLLLA